MYDVTMAGNVADSWVGRYGIGAAIFIKNAGGWEKSSTVNLTNCNLMYNYAKTWGGAIAVCNYKGDSLTLNNCRLENNVTEGNGGAIYVGVEEATINLPDTVIKSNRAENGGGIYIEHIGNTINGSTISYNKATGDGGGIYVK